MKRNITTVIAIGTALCLSSCEKVFDRNAVGEAVPISVEVTGVGTRGSVIDVAALQSGGFVLNGFLEESGRGTNPVHYLADKDFSYSSSKWSGGDDATWINQVQTNLWCHYPKTLTLGGGSRTITFNSSLTDVNQKVITVSYTMPAPSTGDTHNDATLMDDLLFAYARKEYNASAASPDASVKMAFKHILSAIMFTKGTVLNGYDIKSISLVNVLSTGTCTLTGSGEGTLAINWGSQATAQTYTQDVNLTQLGNGEMTATGAKVFWLIPQTTSSTSAVRVVFVKLADNKEIPIDLPLGTSTTWTAGYKYIYKISFDGITAVASQTSSPVNLYNSQQGVWDETTNGLEDYNGGTTGEWGITPSVTITSMGQTDGAW